jgi:hemolysin activation/secretion protein
MDWPANLNGLSHQFKEMYMCTPVITTFLTAVSLVLFLTGFAGANKAVSKGTNVSDTVNRTSYSQSSFHNPAEDTSPRFVVRELRISGNTLISTDELLENLPEFYTIIKRKDEIIVAETYDFRVLREIIAEPGQEREVSKKTIEGLTKYLLSVYREKGYAGIYVSVPAKIVKGAAELEDGILQINILEGKVAKITINRYNFDRQKQEKGVLKSSAIESWSPVKEGEVIRKKKLDEFVNLLNVNPDRYVSAVVSRSDKPDALNLNYDVYEANPWHWYIQVDNAGTKDRQWSPRVGVINTNMTGIDDRFSFMYQATPDSIQENYALFGNYELPLFSPRLRVGAFAGYSQFDITPETGAGISFLGNGWFYGGTLRYNVFQLSDWLFDLLGSISHEESKVTPSLGIKSDVETNLFGLGAEIHRASDMSNTSLLFNVLNSFGGSSKSEFQTARMNSDPDFTIYTASAAHKQFLDEYKIHELSGSFRGVFPDERLIPAKMTTFGGLYSVRGYKENRIVADGGTIGSLQYRFDLTRYENYTIGGTEEQLSSYEEIWPLNISLLAFTDYGQAKIKDPVPGEEETQDLWGAGAGTLLELGKDLDAAIYYAWALHSAQGTDEGDSRLHLSVIYRW